MLEQAREAYEAARDSNFDDNTDLLAIGKIVDNVNPGEEVIALKWILNIIDKEG